MTITVLLFAHYQDAAGYREAPLDAPDGATVATVASLIEARHPGLTGLLAHGRVAVNAEFANAETVLKEGDQVAFLPPMSGGRASLVSLTPDAIDVVSVSRAVEAAGYGAVVTFAGNIRDNSRSQQVAYLEYEAYAPLAEKELRRIAEEAEAHWGGACAIVHRIGRLEIGECSVAVAYAAPHRAEAFEAARWVMDTLKADVPIWKKEYTADGSHWIEGPDAVRATDPCP